MIKTILPHSIEAEQSVLASMLMNRAAISAASEMLTGDDFYAVAHKYASTKFGELNDYYFMLIDQLMGV